jgi:hypothetical protein
MIRLRSFLWLVALLGFVASSFGAASMVHAVQAPQAAVVDCPGHAPPPDPCPARGTAKHLAGDCCPLMSSTLALLPATADGETAVSFSAPVAPPVRHLAGHFYTKDPPPPRV